MTEQTHPLGGTEPQPLLSRLRVAEKLILGFFAYLGLVAWIFPVDTPQRWLILGLNSLACAVVALLGWLNRSPLPPASAYALSGCLPRRLFTLMPLPGKKLLSPARDWLPLLLILVAYRESGLFIRPDTTHHLDQVFVSWDRYLLGNRWVREVVSAGGVWLAGYLEIAYLLCYPLAPLGLGAILRWIQRQGRPSLALEGRQSGAVGVSNAVDHFWTSVLMAAFFAYAVFPFFSLTPPRVLYHDLPPPSPSLFRGANLWILDRYGVQASIFPSGHVAVVTATALGVQRVRRRLGLLFLWAAFSIAVATVLLRYHYAADALTGLVVGAASALLSRGIWRSSIPQREWHTGNCSSKLRGSSGS